LDSSGKFCSTYSCIRSQCWQNRIPLRIHLCDSRDALSCDFLVSCYTPSGTNSVGASLTLGSGALADSFNIDVSDDDIAVQADDAKLTEVLQELENRTGIPVKFVAETEERVTLDVALTDIENAISKLTPNHMIVRGKQDGKDTRTKRCNCG